MLKDFFTLSFGNLKHRGLRSWLTMLGIFIGIAAVVSLISLGSGLQNAIIGQFSTLSVDTLTITNQGTGFGPPGSTSITKLNENDLDLVESTKGVKIAIPRTVRVVSVEFNQARDFKYIGDIPDDSEKRDFIYRNLNLRPQEGRLLEASDSGKIMVGNDFLDESFGKPVRIGSKLEINGKDFEVVGILEEASTFTINSVIMMLNKDLEDLLKLDDEMDIIVAQVGDKDEIEEVAAEIERKFRKDRNLKEGQEDFAVETPLQSLESVNQILVVVNIIVIGIAGVSLLVGGIGITNTMYTSVVERTKEIGIMKAVGARNSDILMIFIIEAGLLGLVGGVIGSVIGLALAFGVSGLAGNFLGGIDLGVEVSYPLIIGSISFSFFIGVLSGILPAFQASGLHPVEALRK